MPNEIGLLYAMVTVFGVTLGGLLVTVLLRPRIVPAMRAWKLRRLDSRVRRALASKSPKALARAFRAALDEATDPVLHARYWTTLGRFSRRIREAASKLEHALPEAQAAAEASAWALYGSFVRAEKVLAAGPAAPGHQSMLRLDMEFLVQLLRDGDARGALVCAHQGVSAAKSPSLRPWMTTWQERLRVAEVIAGHHTFEEIDALIERAETAMSLLLLSWAASAHAEAVGDSGRASVYLTTYRKLAPHGVAPPCAKTSETPAAENQ